MRDMWMILNSTVLPITPIVLKLPIGLIHQMPEMPAPQSTGNFCSTSTSGKPCSKSQPPLGHPPRIGPPSQHSHWGPPNAARAKIPHPWRTHGGAPMVAHPWWRTHGGAPMVPGTCGCKPQIDKHLRPAMRSSPMDSEGCPEPAAVRGCENTLPITRE